MAKPRIPSPPPVSASRRLKYLAELEREYGPPDPDRRFRPALDKPGAMQKFLGQMERQDRDVLNAAGKTAGEAAEYLAPQYFAEEMPPLYHGSSRLGTEEYRVDPFTVKRELRSLAAPNANKVGDVLPGEHLNAGFAKEEGHLGPAIFYGSNNPQRGVYFSNYYDPDIFEATIDPSVKPSDFLPKVPVPMQPNPDALRGLIRELRELKVKDPLHEGYTPDRIVGKMHARIANDYRRLYGIPRQTGWDAYYPEPAINFLANEKIYDIFRKLGIAGLSETYGKTHDFKEIRTQNPLHYKRGAKLGRLQFYPAREDHFAFYRPELIKYLTYTGYSAGAAAVLADSIISQQQQQPLLSGLTEE